MSHSARKLLLVGVGVIGSYLTQMLCEAGHDVCVVARGTWATTIERDGRRIHHYLQHKDTTCHPRVVRELPKDEHFDATFVVMRQDQMIALAPELTVLDTDLVVCVGNNLRVDEVEAAIRAKGFWTIPPREGSLLLFDRFLGIDWAAQENSRPARSSKSPG